MPASLRRLEQLFEQAEWRDRSSFLEARKRARARAREVLAGDSAGREQQTALLVAAAQLLRSLSDVADADPDAARVAAELERTLGISALELAREAVRDPELFALPPDAACRSVLRTIASIVPLRSASLWTADGGKRLIRLCQVGEGRPSRSAQQLARELLAGEARDPGARRLLLGFALGKHREPVGALVAGASHGVRERARALLSQAAPMLAAQIERDALLAADAGTGRALIEASERRLTRLGFDLHDGPIQDLALFAEDLRRFSGQLEDVLGAHEQHELLRGRVEDLEAQLASLDEELRRLSGDLQAASVVPNRPFRAALEERVRAFSARTGIKPSLALAGELEELSSSQQIALLNIVQEALSNIREHAAASQVQVAVNADGGGVRARIADDGVGFELEPTLMRAAREGRIGLIAMNERVRLLGGEYRIDSRPGGPTVVSVSLQRWSPPQAATRAEHAA